MDKREQEFLCIIENAINTLEKVEKSFFKKYRVNNKLLSKLHMELFSLKEDVLLNKLPRPSNGSLPKGIGLGLSKAVGEFSTDEELLDAIDEIEDFFGNSF